MGWIGVNNNAGADLSRQTGAPDRARSARWPHRRDGAHLRGQTFHSLGPDRAGRKPGRRGGNIGSEITAKAAPDGHTILLFASSHVLNSALYDKLPYDPIKDFTPISQVADYPLLLLAHPSVPANSLRELVALAVTSAQRAAIAPEIPAIAESGYPGFEAGRW